MINKTFDLCMNGVARFVVIVRHVLVQGTDRKMLDNLNRKEMKVLAMIALCRPFRDQSSRDSKICLIISLL